jgi:hypothetical protein
MVCELTIPICLSETTVGRLGGEPPAVMKTYLVALILIVGALGARPLIMASPAHLAPAATTCSDCGCCGAGSDGSCTMEKGKTCHCKK